MSQKNKKQKVLIIKLSSLGDVIFNLPLASVLKQNNIEVSWLVSEKGLDIVSDNPLVDKVFLVPFEKWKKNKNILKNFIEFIKIIKSLREEHFDIALDTQMRLKSLFLNLLCGAKRRIIAKDCKEFSYLGANEIIPNIREQFNLHIVKCYLKFATHLGLDTKNYEVLLPESSCEVKSKVDLLLQTLDSKRQTILIAPATTWQGKHWNKNHWKKLVKQLSSNYNIVFTGTNKDQELINYISENRYLNLAGQTNLKDLIEILNRIDLLISLDSGTTHLAWATQKPKIISIFCCTPSTLYSPLGNCEKYIALQSDYCEPCHHKKCKKKTNKYNCTESPSVEKVLNAVNTLLIKELDNAN